MAERPIFVAVIEGSALVKEVSLRLEWHAGFAAVQKEKNIAGLHAAAAAAGYNPVLEVSTKSAMIIGRHLSAFHLTVSSERNGQIPLECVFQGSKVFENGGPFIDLYTTSAREARRDPRLLQSGKLTGFQFEGLAFPLEPTTVFYDWLYLTAIFHHREWLKRLFRYAAFSDIEFNPQRSINCQARSCALFVSLMKRELLEEALASPTQFISLLSKHEYCPQLRAEKTPGPLFESNR